MPTQNNIPGPPPPAPLFPPLTRDYSGRISRRLRLRSKIRLGDILIPLRHVSPPRPVLVYKTKDPGEQLLMRMYADMQKQLGTVPPPEIVMAYHPGLLTAWWALGRESLIIQGVVDRKKKEMFVGMLASGVKASLLQSLHALWIDALGREDVAKVLIGGGSFEAIPEDYQHAFQLGEAIGAGKPTPTTCLLLNECRANPRAAAELLGATLAFDLLARITSGFVVSESLQQSVFGEEVNPLEGLIYRRIIHKFLKEESAEAFLEVDHDEQPALEAFRLGGIDPVLPERFAWAGVHDHLSDAVAYFDREVRALEVWVDAEVRAATIRAIESSPTGKEIQLNSGWSESQRAEAAIAQVMLTEPKKLDKQQVKRYLDTHPEAGQAGLVGLAVWASFQAAAANADRLAAALSA